MALPPPSASRTAQRWTLLAVCLATFMLLVDITIVVVALPDIQHAIGGTFAELQWTIDAYSLSLAALLLAAGSVADLFGRRRVFAAGLVVFTVGSTVCGLAGSADMLIICRAAQGIGGAIMFSTSLALLAQTFHGPERGSAFGIWGATAGMSTALGPVLGGILTSWIDWRAIFLVNVPVGILALAIALSQIPESPRNATARIDLAGIGVFTAGLASLIFGLVHAGEHGWTSSVVIACLSAAGILLAGFVAIELLTRHPVLDLALFRKPSFIGTSVAAFGMNGSLYAMFVYLAIYLQNQLGYSAVQTGVRLMVITGATFVAAVPAGKLSERAPTRLLVGPGLMLVGAGLLLMRGVHADSSWTHLIPGFLAAGFGAGMVNPPMVSTAIGVAQPHQAGMASGINTTFRQIGLATSVAVLGSILATKLHAHHGAPTAFLDGFNTILLIAATLAIATGALALALIRRSDLVPHGPA